MNNAEASCAGPRLAQEDVCCLFGSAKIRENALCQEAMRSGSWPSVLLEWLA